MRLNNKLHFEVDNVKQRSAILWKKKEFTETSSLLQKHTLYYFITPSSWFKT